MPRSNEKSLVIVFFDNENDYRRGDEALSAMPATDTPGQHVGHEMPRCIPHDRLAVRGLLGDLALAPRFR